MKVKLRSKYDLRNDPSIEYDGDTYDVEDSEFSINDDELSGRHGKVIRVDKIECNNEDDDLNYYDGEVYYRQKLKDGIDVFYGRIYKRFMEWPTWMIEYELPEVR